MNAETVRRYALTACAFVFVTCLIGGLFQANVQEWAKATGNDQWMVQYAGVAMANLAATAQTSWFIAVTAFLVGGSVFLWADYFLRGKSKALPQVDTPPSAEDFPEPPAPKKFYSSKEREVFASALFDLRDICKRDGERIVQNVGTFLKDWSSRRSEVSEGKPFEGPYVLQIYRSNKRPNRQLPTQHLLTGWSVREKSGLSRIKRMRRRRRGNDSRP